MFVHGPPLLLRNILSSYFCLTFSLLSLSCINPQAYGPDSTFCNFSVSRWELNCVLMTAAEEAGCTFHFNHPVAHVDVPSATAFFYLCST